MGARKCVCVSSLCVVCLQLKINQVVVVLFFFQPQNIFLTYDSAGRPCAKIGDFGHSRLALWLQQQTHTTQQQHDGQSHTTQQQYNGLSMMFVVCLVM